jgi:hypothetical protein
LEEPIPSDDTYYTGLSNQELDVFGLVPETSESTIKVTKHFGNVYPFLITRIKAWVSQDYWARHDTTIKYFIPHTIWPSGLYGLNSTVPTQWVITKYQQNKDYTPPPWTIDVTMDEYQGKNVLTGEMNMVGYIIPDKEQRDYFKYAI